VESLGNSRVKERETQNGKDRPPYRVKGAAEALGVSDKVILSALKSGRLYGFKLTPAGPWLIPGEGIERLLRGAAA
jgi:hypothetical protein